MNSRAFGAKTGGASRFFVRTAESRFCLGLLRCDRSRPALCGRTGRNAIEVQGNIGIAAAVALHKFYAICLYETADGFTDRCLIPGWNAGCNAELLCAALNERTHAEACRDEASVDAQEKQIDELSALPKTRY